MADDKTKLVKVTASKNIMNRGTVVPAGTVFDMSAEDYDAHVSGQKNRRESPFIFEGDQSKKILAELAVDEEEVHVKDEKTGEVKIIRRKKTRGR